ncbi:HTH-type transcriptional regulator MalT [bioreactor metagenome]|uniref:HTH-type transcriptional regulator MalT n=1 Tax=bioreactor metagenome TaxID=1076179 RepID=A0A644WJ40_9ZZZZ
MKPRKSAGTEPHYYSDRLIRKLEALRTTPATVVEAPSGYGKSTAVRDFLEERIPRTASVCWFTIVDETPSASYRRFCQELNKIDSRTEQKLSKIGLPNATNVGEMADAIRALDCGKETYFVMDNFQILPDGVPESFLRAMIEHGGKQLHIIIITQVIKRNLLTAISGKGVLRITAADLRLDAEDILRYYALSGARITREQAESIERFTEGWMIAVYLQLRAYKETETLSDNGELLSLMELLVWDKLSEEQQNFLLRISPFAIITATQASAILECEKLPEYALQALGNTFIRYEVVGRRYELHSILIELLIQKRKELGDAYERECLLRAGDIYHKEGKNSKALELYWEAKDYDRMLSLDFSQFMHEYVGKKPFSEFALDVARNCPAKIKKTYLLSMLRVTWALLIAGFVDEFDIQMKELRRMLENSEELNTALRGEWLLLHSWRRLPDLEKMNRLVRNAATFLGGTCSRVILPNCPWCFGNFSMLSVFHSKPGEADREADQLEKFIALYSRLTGGHGAGADLLFRAELAHYRGDLNEAKVLAYKACHIAGKKQQCAVQLGAALHLAEIAVEKSDAAGWQSAIDSMEKAATTQGQTYFILRSTVDILRALLLNELGHQSLFAGWLKTGDTADKILPGMRLSALFVRMSYLVHEKDYTLLAGIAEAELEGLHSSDVLTDTLFSLFAAVGHISLGNRGRALELLDHAANIALPDGFVYLFAVYYWLLQGLPERLVKDRYPELAVRFIEIKERFLTGFNALHEAISTNKLPGSLTSREREVAMLAAEGLRNNEIAKKLMVSENTIRFHLRAVFQKLDIDRRAKLAEKLK